MVTAELLKKFDFRAMGLGYLFFVGTNHAFNYILYPYVIYQRGPLLGGVIMILLSTAACLVDVLIYDLVKKDWLGIEAIKEIREDIKSLGDYEAKKLHKMLAWFLKKGRWAEFLFLSLKFDPFVTTVYMRNGVKKFNGFKKEEWRIFIGSIVLANVYWIIVSASGLEIYLNLLNYSI